MDILGIITAIIGVISLLALIYQTINLRITISNQIYQSFINNSIEIDKILIQYPNICKYVYDGISVEDTTEDLDRIMSVVELIIDASENIDIYKRYIPKSRLGGWMQFVKDTQKTPAYKYFMDKHKEWFEIK